RFLELDWPPATPTGVPAAPAGLAGSTDAAGAVHLSWSAVSGATQYRVYRQYVTGGQTHFARYSVPVTGTSVDYAGGFVRGHRYDFKVTAENANGEGAFSSAVTVTPTAPTDPSLVLGAGGAGAVAGSYLVSFKSEPAVTAAGVEAFARELTGLYGATLGKLYPQTLNGFSATMTQATAIAMSAHPDVLSVEQDQEENALRAGGTQSNPPWGLDRIDQTDLPPDQLYRYPNGGDGVTIYVADTGVRITHQDISGRASGGYNAFTGSADTDDCNGHGTAVADVAAGTVNGVAKRATIFPVLIMDCQGKLTTQSVVDGFEYIAKNAKKPAVVNISAGWGIGRSQARNRAVLSVIGAGVPVVGAAANDGSDVCDSAPDGLADVIAVGSTDQPGLVDKKSDFSAIGKCLDLFAPGRNIPAASNSSDTATGSRTGCSFAAPHVAGAVAMILSAHPDYSPAQVSAALLSAATSNKILDPGTDSPNKLLYVEQAPQPASNLAATPKPDGTIGLSWTASPTPKVEYLVSQRDVTQGETTFHRWTASAGTGTTATATGLAEGHTYEFTVAASNTMGISAESNVASAVSHMQPPGPPTNLTATAKTDGTIGLSWTSPGGNVWFNVYQRDVTAGETDFTQLPLPVTTCCAMTAGYLTHHHVYEFQVTATNQGGESVPSNRASATSVYPPPAAPTGLTAAAGDGQVVLTWARQDDVWFTIYQRDVTAGET
ncbi:MAG: S8 family serine peptidase, partial [Catenulispora sp.]